MMDIHSEVSTAESQIREYIRETPLEHSSYLSQLVKFPVYLKLENLQITGSFKLRGAINKLLSLTAEEKAKGVVTASTGNHGLAVAYGLDKLKTPGVIFLPESVEKAKLKKLEQYGVDIRFQVGDPGYVEKYAREYSLKEGLIYISPYNDPQIIGGQGTVGVELLRQDPAIDTLFVAVGGGGLISGIAGYMKKTNPALKVFGCLPEHSPVMYESVKAGEIIDYETKETLSDGTAGGVDSDAITFESCRDLVDEWVTVTESEIKDSLKLVFEEQRLVVEGAAAVAVAAFLKNVDNLPGQAVAIVLCGGNTDIAKFKNLVF